LTIVAPLGLLPDHLERPCREGGMSPASARSPLKPDHGARGLFRSCATRR